MELLNLEDNTSAVTSTVRLDEPLFQPYPVRVVFEAYEAFGQQEKVGARTRKPIMHGGLLRH